MVSAIFDCRFGKKIKNKVSAASMKPLSNSENHPNNPLRKLVLAFR
jgi:hypothetical protein